MTYRALEHIVEQTNESMFLGEIKFKFTVPTDVYLEEAKHHNFCQQFERVRTTPNFTYVELGHTDITSNAQGRDWIRSIDALKGKITRLDFTIDIMQCFDFQAYYQAKYEQYTAWTDKERIGKPLPQIISSPKGHTVQIGKRSSARVLRLYDKKAEILAKTGVDIEMPLSRFELEVKRECITTYKLLFMAGETRAILSDIAKRYDLGFLCQDCKKVKPHKIAMACEGPLAFVQRFRRVIRNAFLLDSPQFYDILGLEIEERPIDTYHKKG